MLDWIAALRWVQENVAAFGGDASAVTIAGQSAGGMACATLLATERARGLFQRAILMSGAAHAPIDPGPEVAARIAAALGAAPTRSAFADLSVERVLEAQQRTTGLERTAQNDPVALAKRFADRLLPLGPAPDGELLTMTPIDAITTGAGYDVDVLVGTISEESNSVALAIGEIDDGVLREALGAGHCVDVPFAFDLLDAQGVDVAAGDHPPQELADAVHAAWVGFVVSGDPGWDRSEETRRPTMVFDEESRVVEDPNAGMRSTWDEVL